MEIYKPVEGLAPAPKRLTTIMITEIINNNTTTPKIVIQVLTSSKNADDPSVTFWIKFCVSLYSFESVVNPVELFKFAKAMLTAVARTASVRRAIMTLPARPKPTWAFLSLIRLISMSLFLPPFTRYYDKKIA